MLPFDSLSKEEHLGKINWANANQVKDMCSRMFFLSRVRMIVAAHVSIMWHDPHI